MPESQGPKSLPTLDQAVETFVLGFSQSRSLTYPYPADRIGRVWAVRDAGRKNAADYRREEYVACDDVPPTEVNAFARGQTRGNFAVCYIVPEGGDDGPARRAFKGLNYRLRCSEPIFVHPLKPIARPDSAIRVERVADEALAVRVAKYAGRPMSWKGDLTVHAPLRSYVALDAAGDIMGHVCSGRAGDRTYCSFLFTDPAHRRKGVARNLLLRMLRDDRATGAGASVLTSSQAGAMLYPTVGYRRLATLLLFKPKA